LRFTGFSGIFSTASGLKRRALLLASIAFVAFAADEKTTFQAKPAASYAHKQTSEKVTIAAEQFITDEQAKEAFGKVNPWRLGVLPVLVVIQNDSPAAVRIDRIQFTYVLPDRSKVEATPAGELRFLKSFKPPTNNPQFPKIPGLGKNKNPLAGWEIEGRALSAKMIPPGQSVSGFVYFQLPNSSAASTLYVSGLMNAVSGAELYYFEVPL
jgi:hypothetical protein